METADINILRLSLDTDKLIRMLNKAQYHEWLTYYQSWIGAMLMEGPMVNKIKSELFIHSDQELNHALLIKSRMLQLGIKPYPEPSDTMEKPHCQVPSDPYIAAILNQNILSEHFAIDLYKEIADFTYKKDRLTYHLVTSILGDELAHVRDIERWLNDILNVQSDFSRSAILNNLTLTNLKQ